MRRIILRVWVLCWLILVWMLLWGSVSAANALSGLAVALVITVLLPLPRVPIEGRLHPLSLLRLAVQIAYYLVLSSAQVAWLAIRPGPPPLTAVLRAHMGIKSDLVLALAVNALNLIPGGIVLEIDQARRMIYVHVLDVGSERSVRRFYSQVAEVERLIIRHSSATRIGSPRRTGRAHEHPVDHLGGDAGRSGGDHHVPSTGGARHPGQVGRPGHLRRGDDVLHRHLGSVQPRYDGDLQSDGAGLISFVGSVSVARFRVRDKDSSRDGTAR